MNRELLYFTLALAAVYLLFDQFIGNKNLSRLSDKLWNNNMKEPEPKAEEGAGKFADDSIGFASANGNSYIAPTRLSAVK